MKTPPRLTIATMLAVSTTVFAGCTTHRYAHWEDDWDGATTRAHELSETRRAEVVSTAGDTVDAWNLSFSPEALTWTTRVPTEVSTLPLSQVREVSMIQRRRTREGAFVGAVLGVIIGGLSFADDDQEFIGLVPLHGDPAPYFGRIAVGTLIGTGVGAAVGASLRERVHFSR